MASGSMVCQATVVVVGSDNGAGVLLLTVSIVANEFSFSRMVIVASSESLSSLYCNELPLDNYPTLARPLGSLPAVIGGRKRPISSLKREVIPNFPRCITKSILHWLDVPFAPICAPVVS